MIHPTLLRRQKQYIKDNPYFPSPARIVRIIPMVKSNHLFQFRFEEPEMARNFTYRPGQFMMLSVIGTGESPISISSTPTRPGILEMCVRKVGRVTNHLYTMKENDLVGLRGPYGNGFPVEEMKGHDLLVIAGGLGMAPLRSLLNYVLDNRSDYKRIVLMYGTRSPQDILFRDELEALEKRQDIECLLTVDYAYDLPEVPKWHGNVGLLPELFSKVKLDPLTTYAAVCGPPVVYKFVLAKLLERDFSKDRILMSLERKMKCGIGKCGHCSVGYKYTCIDGPIFTYWDAINLPEII
jgi:NAD(P)H-flavin reductase